jgi:hypothetical protein
MKIDIKTIMPIGWSYQQLQQSCNNDQNSWNLIIQNSPSIASILQCVCTHPIDSMGIHLLCCAHGNKRIGTHDAICNNFATIMWDVSFHVGRKQFTCASFKHIQFLSLMNQHCAY